MIELFIGKIVIAEIDDSREPIVWRWRAKNRAPAEFVRRVEVEEISLISGGQNDAGDHFTTATPTKRMTRAWLDAALDGTLDIEVRRT